MVQVVLPYLAPVSPLSFGHSGVSAMSGHTEYTIAVLFTDTSVPRVPVDRDTCQSHAARV